MLWVSELTVARWPPCADVLDSAVRHLVFIYIYGFRGTFAQSPLKSGTVSSCVSRPHSTDSATHRKMTLSLADRCSKTQKIRILPMAGRDPESHRNEMIKVTHVHVLSVGAVWVCLWSAGSGNASVATGTKNCGIRPILGKCCLLLHKEITWCTYVMRSHSGQWNGNGVCTCVYVCVRVCTCVYVCEADCVSNTNTNHIC